MKVHKGTILLTIPQHVFGGAVGAFLLIKGYVSPYWLIVSYFSWVMIGVLGVGTFFHKYWSHKAFKTYPVVEWLGTYFGCLAGLGSPFIWVSIHNDHHHKYTDEGTQDLHSPINGFFISYIGWQFLEIKLRSKTTKKLLNSAPFRFFSQYYYFTYWLTALILFLINPYLPVFVLFLPGLVHFHIEAIISSFCHTKKWGYRNFDTKDNSVNIFWLGVLTWGAGFHNNHHGLPRSKSTQYQSYEIDASRLILAVIPKKQ